MSKNGATRPRVTSRILLNKWQRQKEKGLSALVRRARKPASTGKRGMKESKLNHIGIVLSLDIARMKV